MAIKLTQGADASIVTGATRAGLAMTPRDYSKTFQAVANSYTNTIASSAAMWSQIGNAVGEIAAEVGKNAAIEQGYSDKASGLLNIEGNEFIYNDIKNNKEKMKNSYRGIILDDEGNQITVAPNSEEAKRYRRKLKTEKESLYKQIDDHFIVRETAREAILSGNIDYTALEPGQAEILNAIVAYGTPSGKTKKGNYVRLSKDENNELVYTLYNDKQQVIGKQDADETDKVFTQKDPLIGPKRAGEGKEFKFGGKNVSITATGLNSLLVPPNENLRGDYAKIGADLVNIGKQVGGEYSNYTKTEVKSRVEILAGKTPATLRQSMNTRINGVSFIEDMNREGSEISQSLFVALGNVVGVDPKTGTIPKTGLLAGVDEMTDGKKGISRQDLQNPRNMKILQYSLVYDDNNYAISKEVFANWATNKYTGSYQFGANQYTDPNSKTSKLTQKQLEIQSQVNTLNSVLDGKTPRKFSFQGGNLSVIIDPISKTITQKDMDENEDTITPQSFLDLYTKTPGLLDAREIFGSDYFSTIPGETEKNKDKDDKPGTMFSRFFFPSLYK